MDALRCTIMRGGTSKGVFFLDHDLPQDKAAREGVAVVGESADAAAPHADRAEFRGDVEGVRDE